MPANHIPARPSSRTHESSQVLRVFTPKPMLPSSSEFCTLPSRYNVMPFRTRKASITVAVTQALFLTSWFRLKHNVQPRPFSEVLNRFDRCEVTFETQEQALRNTEKVTGTPPSKHFWSTDRTMFARSQPRSWPHSDAHKDPFGHSFQGC